MSDVKKNSITGVAGIMKITFSNIFQISNDYAGYYTIKTTHNFENNFYESDFLSKGASTKNFQCLADFGCWLSGWGVWVNPLKEEKFFR